MDSAGWPRGRQSPVRDSVGMFSLLISHVGRGRLPRTLRSCHRGASRGSAEELWETDQSLEKLLPLALLLLRVGAIRPFTAPPRARLPLQTAGWTPAWCGPAVSSRGVWARPAEWSPATRGRKSYRTRARGPQASHSASLLSSACSFRTDPDRWSESTPG